MLSSDVSAAYDPMFAEAFEKRSSAFFGKGLVFNKFTGSRGKSGSNDANAEYLAQIRKALDTDGVAYQFAELGKVDVGGGGTIAYIMANYGMEVIDSGVAILCMHAPWEIASKADIYEAYKGYKAFLKKYVIPGYKRQAVHARMKRLVLYTRQNMRKKPDRAESECFED